MPKLLNIEEKERIKAILYAVNDNLSAIASEINTDKPYSEYINEKLKPIINDINCIQSIIS